MSAILAADVAGYSRLMHDAEEATHTRLTALLTGGVSPAIIEHGGRIVKNTGDGFLAEFPSTVEAVRAAVIFEVLLSQIGELDSDLASDLIVGSRRYADAARFCVSSLAATLTPFPKMSWGSTITSPMLTPTRKANAPLLPRRAEPQTEAHINEALRLSPRDIDAFRWKLGVGVLKLHLGADAEAVAWIRRSIEANPNQPMAHFYLAASLARLGELKEARAAARDGLTLNPAFTVRRFRAYIPSDNPTFLAGRERMYEGLRLAGVPEG